VNSLYVLKKTITVKSLSKQNMIKKLLIHLYVLCLCVVAHTACGQITLGAKTGVNLNQFSQPGTIIGVNAGIYGAYRVNSFLSVKLEPQYSQEGGGRPGYTRQYSEISNDISSVEFVNPSVRFHNLQIPLFVELTLPELSDQTIVPVLMLGGSYAMTILTMEEHTKRYHFAYTSESSGGSPYYPASLDVSYQRENVIDNYARNQWSLWFGMGLQFKGGERTYSFDVRYRQGLNNLNNLRFASPGNGVDIGVPGTGGNLRSSSLSFNFSMSLFNF
jgi:hypothetical protein